MEPSRQSLCVQVDQKDIRIVRANSKPPTSIGTHPKRKKGLWNRLIEIPSLGIILGVLSSFSFSVAIMLVKVIKGVDPMFFVLCRGTLQLFLFYAVGIFQGLNVEVLKSKKVLLNLFLTGFLGSVAQVLAYGSLKFIPLGDATAIILSAPVFVSFFACVLLKEKCGVFQVVTVIIAVIGVLLVCRPTFIFGRDDAYEISATDHIIGTSMVAAGCLSLAGLYVTLRKISHVPIAITNSSLGITSITVSLVMLVVEGNWHVPYCGLESVLLVVSASAGTTGMLLFVCATKVEDAGPLSVVRTSEIIFAFIWQMGLLGHIPTWTTLAGAGAIVSSVVLTGMQKWTSKYMFCISADCCNCDRGSLSRTPPRPDARSNEPLPMQGLLNGERC